MGSKTIIVPIRLLLLTNNSLMKKEYINDKRNKKANKYSIFLLLIMIKPHLF